MSFAEGIKLITESIGHPPLLTADGAMIDARGESASLVVLLLLPLLPNSILFREIPNVEARLLPISGRAAGRVASEPDRGRKSSLVGSSGRALIRLNRLGEPPGLRSSEFRRELGPSFALSRPRNPAPCLYCLASLSASWRIAGKG